MPLDWDKLRCFHAVAEAGSFTHAGETLNLSQSAVSRQIQALEEALAGPALPSGHARGLILTEQGETLNRAVREVFAKLAMTEALLTESRERPTGRLKVTTTNGFGSIWLAPRLQPLPAAASRRDADRAARRADLDLAMREADVAIRMHPPRQPDLIQRNLGTFGWRVCGSPDYLNAWACRRGRRTSMPIGCLCTATTARRWKAENWLAEAGRRPAAARARCSR
jgi:DNA-binding transcriptional LysR family regulator